MTTEVLNISWQTWKPKYSVEHVGILTNYLYFVSQCTNGFISFSINLMFKSLICSEGPTSKPVGWHHHISKLRSLTVILRTSGPYQTSCFFAHFLQGAGVDSFKPPAQLRKKCQGYKHLECVCIWCLKNVTQGIYFFYFLTNKNWIYRQIFWNFQYNTKSIPSYSKLPSFF